MILGDRRPGRCRCRTSVQGARHRCCLRRCRICDSPFGRFSGEYQHSVLCFLPMKKVYVYVLNDMAECEIGYILQAFSMEKLLKNGTKEFEVKTVACNKKPILTLGGLTIIPDRAISEVDFSNIAALLLPGSSAWGSEDNQEILKKAQECLRNDILVGAICGATLALADYGILDRFKHTSNSLEYLNFFSKNYAGQDLYVCSNSVSDRNLVTANSAGSLEWTKDILKNLNVYSDKKIDAFYNYYSTGDAKYYDELLQ